MSSITQCYKCEEFKPDNEIIHMLMPSELESHQPVCSDCLHLEVKPFPRDLYNRAISLIKDDKSDE